MIDTTHRTEIVCPHCGEPALDESDWLDPEMLDGHRELVSCHACGGQLRVTLHVTYTFSTEKKRPDQALA